MSDAGDNNGVGRKLDELRLAVENSNALSNARYDGVVAQLHQFHDSVVEQLQPVQAGIEVVRVSAVENGLAIARLEATCAGRGATCGEIHAELRRKQDRHSRELNHLGGDMREVSQVTAVENIRRQQLRATFRTVWAVGWKVLFALATVGALGAWAAELVKLTR
jgi:hypothetical protein